MNNPQQPDPVKEVPWVINPEPVLPPSGSIAVYLVAVLFVAIAFIGALNEASSPDFGTISLKNQKKNTYRTVNTVEMFPNVPASEMPSWNNFLDIYRMDALWENRTYANYYENIDPEKVTGTELSQPIPRERELKIFFAEKDN